MVRWFENKMKYLWGTFLKSIFANLIFQLLTPELGTRVKVTINASARHWWGEKTVALDALTLKFKCLLGKKAGKIYANLRQFETLERWLTPFFIIKITKAFSCSSLNADWVNTTILENIWRIFNKMLWFFMKRGCLKSKLNY